MSKARKLTLFNVFLYAKSQSFFFVILSAAAACLDVYLRRYMGIIVDGLQEDIHTINWLLIGITVPVFLILKYILPWLKTQTTHTLLEKIREQLVYKALHTEQKALEQMDPGTVSTYYMSDVDGIVRYAGRILEIGIPDILIFVLSVLAVALMDPYLSLAAVLSSIVPVLAMYFMSRALVKKNMDYQASLERINQSVGGRLYNLEFIKANRMEAALEKENAALLDALHREKKALSKREAALSFPTMITSFLTVLIVALLGGYFVLTSRMSIGSLFSAIALTDYIVSPVMRFQNTISQIRRASANVSRINAFLETKNESAVIHHIQDGKDQFVSITAHNLSFSYSEDKPVLKGINIHWEAGKLNVLVGQNGTGKSTFLKLLTGLFPVDDGQIQLGGAVISDAPDVDVLRKKITVDTQNTLLLPGTIWYNLTLGADLDRNTVDEACRKAGLYEEIQHLAVDYDTYLDDDGKPLSGGQKRRLCFARTLLKDAPIYVFDEPTVGVDPNHISIIISTLKTLAKEKLVVVITHDQSIIQEADTVTHIGIGGLS